MSDPKKTAAAVLNEMLEYDRGTTLQLLKHRLPCRPGTKGSIDQDGVPTLTVFGIIRRIAQETGASVPIIDDQLYGIDQLYGVVSFVESYPDFEAVTGEGDYAYVIPIAGGTVPKGCEFRDENGRWWPEQAQWFSEAEVRQYHEEGMRFRCPAAYHGTPNQKAKEKLAVEAIERISSHRKQLQAAAESLITKVMERKKQAKMNEVVEAIENMFASIENMFASIENMFASIKP